MSSGTQTIRGGNLAIAGILAVVLVVGAWFWGGAAQTAKVAQNHYTISMTDYAFAPNRMIWRVGDKVTITLVDDSQSHPAKDHEFMVGRGPNTKQTAFGLRYEDGFKTPFFAGVTINIDAGSGLKMLMAGPAKFTGVKPADVTTPDPNMKMEKMTGFMPLLGGSKLNGGPSRLTFSFVVPDRTGTWTFGCFQQSGQHFANGMKGTIEVVKQAA